MTLQKTAKPYLITDMIIAYLALFETNLRVNGKKIKLTSISDEEQANIEDTVVAFWDETAS